MDLQNLLMREAGIREGLEKARAFAAGLDPPRDAAAKYMAGDDLDTAYLHGCRVTVERLVAGIDAELAALVPQKQDDRAG